MHVSYAQEKADLVDGASPSMKDPGLMQDQEMLDEAGKIQGKDKQAARRMLKMVAQTEEVASSTMETMKNQTEQLSKIHSDLEEMDSTLKLADAQIKQYVRKMATDKLIMMMLFIIVMGLVAIMVLKTLGMIGSDQVNVPDEVTDSAKDMVGRRAMLDDDDDDAAAAAAAAMLTTASGVGGTGSLGGYIL